MLIRRSVLLVLFAGCPVQSPTADAGLAPLDAGVAPFDAGPVPTATHYGWTRTGGTAGDDAPLDLALTPAGEIFLVFQDTAAFHDTLVKLTPAGDVAWTRALDPGIDVDLPVRLAASPAGDLYLTGSFRGTVDFDVGPGVDSRRAQGGDDAFVTRINSDGTHAWTKTYGEAFLDNGRGIAVDPSSGEVIVVGFFEGNVDFNPGGPSDVFQSASDPTMPGRYLTSGFLQRLRADGSRVFTRAIPGWPERVAVDGAGDLTLAGSFFGAADFDWTGGVDGVSTDLNDCGGSASVTFVTRAGGDGSYGWTRLIPCAAVADAMAVDALGTVFVAGTYSSDTDFNAGTAADLHPVAPGHGGIGQDLFLTRLEADGGYGWTNTPITFGAASVGSLVVDARGNPLVAGGFTGSIDFGRATSQQTANGLDALLWENSGDQRTGWNLGIGGAGAQRLHALTRNGTNQLAALGSFEGTSDFDFTHLTTDLRTSLGARDWFVTTFTLK